MGTCQKVRSQFALFTAVEEPALLIVLMVCVKSIVRQSSTTTIQRQEQFIQISGVQNDIEANVYGGSGLVNPESTIGNKRCAGEVQGLPPPSKSKPEFTVKRTRTRGGLTHGKEQKGGIPSASFSPVFRLQCMTCEAYVWRKDKFSAMHWVKTHDCYISKYNGVQL